MTEEEKVLAKEKAKDKAKTLLAVGKNVAKETTEKAVSKAGVLKEVVEEKVQEYEESDDFDEETKKKHILIGLGFVIFCGVLLVSLVSSLFGGGSMDDDDYFHLLNLHGTAVQSKIGLPNNIVTYSGGTRWIYSNFTLELGISSHVEQVTVTHKSIELAGCSISDSLKSVEKTMKKMDGKFLGSQADVFYSFEFQYKKKTYHLGCIVDYKGNIESLVLSF